jgi:hypothetical protein
MQRTAQNGTHQRADGVDPETRAKGRNSPPRHRSDEPRPEVAGGVHSAPIEWRDGHDESGHCGADECRTSVRRDLLATDVGADGVGVYAVGLGKQIGSAQVSV